MTLDQVIEILTLILTIISIVWTIIQYFQHNNHKNHIFNIFNLLEKQRIGLKNMCDGSITKNSNTVVTHKIKPSKDVNKQNNI